MTNATPIQNQNAQLIKTFIIAFGAVLLAIPVVTIITAAIVRAQFASIVSASPYPAYQTNTLGNVATANQCELPENEKQSVLQGSVDKETNAVNTVVKRLPWVSQSNHYSQTTSTSTKTTTIEVKNNGNSSTDNRWSGNSVTKSDNRVDNRWSGNSVTTDNSNQGNDSSTKVTTIVTDNGNTNNQTWNQQNNSVNNSNNDNSNTEVNTTVNAHSNNTYDNDLIDLL